MSIGRGVGAGLAAILFLAAGGCATVRVESASASAAETECRAALATIDAAVTADGAGDGMSTRIDGFPYLRVNRLLASYRDELAHPDAERFWVDRLLELDRAARSVELANLRSAARDRLRVDLGLGPSAESLTELVVRCGRVLREADDRAPSRLAALRARAVVPDDYSLAQRVMGLYPVVSLPFAQGVRSWERTTAASFAMPIENVPVRGMLWSYSPAVGEVAPRARIADIIARAEANPLRIPLPGGADLETLVRTFAPVFEIDSLTDDDRIGAPRLSDDGSPRIDTRRPTVYVRVTATRVAERALLQIVYSVWFPARPKSGPFDLLGGTLDGLIWRVTLAPDGSPLVFDTIHACGCYHLFFPSPAATPKAPPASNEEFVFVPQRLAPMPEGARVVLRIESRTHYLQRVSFEPARIRAVPYELAGEDDLRSLAIGLGERRSLYGPEGLVPGTERGERWFFWPMGIASAGAMRQYGRHATAFVGRRHFDDARLIEERFRLALPF